VKQRAFQKSRLQTDVCESSLQSERKIKERQDKQEISQCFVWEALKENYEHLHSLLSSLTLPLILPHHPSPKHPRPPGVFPPLEGLLPLFEGHLPREGLLPLPEGLPLLPEVLPGLRRLGCLPPICSESEPEIHALDHQGEEGEHHSGPLDRTEPRARGGCRAAAPSTGGGRWARHRGEWPEGDGRHGDGGGGGAVVRGGSVVVVGAVAAVVRWRWWCGGGGDGDGVVVEVVVRWWW